jgi:hypothetical protein
MASLLPDMMRNDDRAKKTNEIRKLLKDSQ